MATGLSDLGWSEFFARQFAAHAADGLRPAPVVGVLTEVPVMLILVKICLKTQRRFPARA